MLPTAILKTVIIVVAIVQRDVAAAPAGSVGFSGGLNAYVASGCSSRLDDVEECLGGFDDVCEEACGREGDALNACLVTYCNESQDPLCSFGDSQ